MALRIRYKGAGEFAFPVPWNPDDTVEAVLFEGKIVELPNTEARAILQRYPVVERVYEVPEGETVDILEIRGKEVGE